MIKTFEEAIELLKAGRTLRFFYMVGSVSFNPNCTDLSNVPYISMEDFTKMKQDGIIDCESNVKNVIL